MVKNNINWQESSVLITGGTGSFGKKFVETMKSYFPNESAAIDQYLKLVTKVKK